MLAATMMITGTCRRCPPFAPFLYFFTHISSLSPSLTHIHARARALSLTKHTRGVSSRSLPFQTPPFFPPTHIFFFFFSFFSFFSSFLSFLSQDRSTQSPPSLQISSVRKVCRITSIHPQKGRSASTHRGKCAQTRPKYLTKPQKQI